MDRSKQAPQLRSLPVTGPSARESSARQMAYWEWSPESGDAGQHVVICVHGLSRQGRDFDELARVLSMRSKVLAVDVAGRGHSDWLADPMAYQIATYAADLAALLAQVRQESPGVKVDWVGTSMGGLIGMAVSAQPSLAPRRLVLNDVGPVVQWTALQRIAGYLGQNPSFDSEEAAAKYLASISAGFGPHSPAQWATLCQPMLRQREGRWWLHYDPDIALPLRALVHSTDEAVAQQAVRDGEAALWGLYDAITASTLLLRGAESDLLTRETVTQMTQRGPKARCEEIAGVGHAPTLVADDQIALVRDFLWAA